MPLLSDRVCMITGAGQGLGRAVALEMAREGARVVLLERNPDTLQAVAAEIAAAGGSAAPYTLDVTDYETYGRIAADVIAKQGRIDVLVNNAAINPDAKTILEDRLEDWRRTLAINLEAVYMGSKLVAPQMVKQKDGRIISIASIQGFASSGTVGAYNAAKGG
ncbi:SDR family oxidoreductase, partial [Hypericibacter adhaerens]